MASSSTPLPPPSQWCSWPPHHRYPLHQHQPPPWYIYKFPEEDLDNTTAYGGKQLKPWTPEDAYSGMEDDWPPHPAFRSAWQVGEQIR